MVRSQEKAMLNISCRRKLTLTLLTLLLAAPCSHGQTARKRLEADAERLPMLQLDGYMNFEETDSETLLKARVLHEQLIKEMFEVDLPTKELLPLLKHGNPKVRTLAIMALINKEDPKLLPDIQALVKDEAETFGNPPRNKSARTALDKELPEITTMPKLGRRPWGTWRRWRSGCTSERPRRTISRNTGPCAKIAPTVLRGLSCACSVPASHSPRPEITWRG